MFNELGSDIARWWLTGLLILWAILLFGGFIFGSLNADSTHRIPRWARMASSFTLVVAAWSVLLFLKDTPLAQFTLLVAIGMSLGFIGDLFMAQLLIQKDYVLGGIASFGLGHIAYIVALYHLADAVLPTSGLPWAALIVWWCIGAVGWYVVVFRGGERTALHYAALPYALLLATTAGMATGIALQSPVIIPLAVGAALFLLSDLLLAAQLFNQLHFRSIGDAVWALYGPAQMLIVFGSLNAALTIISG